MNIIHVVGTGTIGEPLIGLLSLYKKEFGIDEVTFHKNSPLEVDKTKVEQLLSRGALLAVNKDKVKQFEALNLKPSLMEEEAIERASVVIDCTPKGIGLANKRNFYDRYKDKVKGFVAQGSEDGFGAKFAHNIVPFPNNQFIQVVSCNTHSIATVLKSFDNPFSSAYPGGVISGDFTCIRRASDISQDEDFIPAIELDGHKYDDFGTHHAKDAFTLLKDKFPATKLFSSSLVANTQYMHVIRFVIQTDHINNLTSKEAVLNAFKENEMVALTNKTTSNRVFGFGRDYGLYGRILNQAVICAPTINIDVTNRVIRGMLFTPQDGNSLLSSISAALHFLHPGSVGERLACLSPYIFKEI